MKREPDDITNTRAAKCCWNCKWRGEDKWMPSGLYVCSYKLNELGKSAWESRAAVDNYCDAYKRKEQ